MGLLVAVWMTHSDYAANLVDRANRTMPKYDFRAKPADKPTENSTDSQQQQRPGEPMVLSVDQKRTARMAPDEPPAINGTEATDFWDRLQGLGCCGLSNSTDWQLKFGMLPKSCCAEYKLDINNRNYYCEKTDANHEFACNLKIDSLSSSVLIALALAALVNLGMATLTGVSTCKHFHYTEANQSAYS